jgi:hypothetical protein
MQSLRTKAKAICSAIFLSLVPTLEHWDKIFAMLAGYFGKDQKETY